MLINESLETRKELCSETALEGEYMPPLLLLVKEVFIVVSCGNAEREVLVDRLNTRTRRSLCTLPFSSRPRLAKCWIIQHPFSFTAALGHSAKDMILWAYLEWETAQKASLPANSSSRLTLPRRIWTSCGP